MNVNFLATENAKEKFYPEGPVPKVSTTNRCGQICSLLQSYYKQWTYLNQHWNEQASL